MGQWKLDVGHGQYGTCTYIEMYEQIMNLRSWCRMTMSGLKSPTENERHFLMQVEIGPYSSVRSVNNPVDY